jgi:hypothetical protein
MRQQESNVRFMDPPQFYEFEPARTIDIPAGIATEEELFSVYVRGLEFPPYFGWNWNAFHDCLSDLRYLKTRLIALVHHDLPRLPREKLGWYVEEICDCVESHLETGDPVITVYFPEKCRAEFMDLLGERRLP